MRILWINLDDLMQNYKENTQYEGKIKAVMKEQQCTLDYKRQDRIRV